MMGPSAKLVTWRGDEEEFATRHEALEAARSRYGSASERAGYHDGLTLFVEADEDGEYVIAKVEHL